MPDIPNNKMRYAGLCAANNDLPLFLHDYWLDAACGSWDVAIVKNGNAVSGVWPYPIQKHAGITIHRNPALTPYLGPHIFYPPDLKESKRDNFEHETIAALLQQLPRFDVWAAALNPGLKQAGLFHHAGFTSAMRQTFIMDLAGHSEDEIFARLHEDYRRNIRKAAQELTITNDEGLLPKLYQFQQETLGRKKLKMSYPLCYMKQLYSAAKSHDRTALYVAAKGDQPQAILWHLWDDVRAYYLVGAKNPAVKDSRAVTALIWHAIRESHATGKISFDFEGSMDPGVEHFFRHFGARRELYPVLTKNDSLLWRLKSLIRR